MDKPDETTYHFPLALWDTSQAFQDQPNRPILKGTDYARTTADALNVRAMDPINSLLRGGSRTGLSQFIPQQANGFGLIQDLDVIVWTDPGAVGSGGGYQPPPDNPTLSFTMTVGYVFTGAGFQVVVRLLNSTPLARTSTLTNSLAILSPVVAPLSDFTNNQGGFKVRLRAVDQGGNAIFMNGLAQIIQPLRMNNNMAGPALFLGIPATDIAWTTTYPSNPTPTSYTATATLLDASDTPVLNLDGGGSPSGGNVEQSFSITFSSAIQYVPVTIYIAKEYQIDGGAAVDNYTVFKKLELADATAAKPTLSATVGAIFWAVSSIPSGPGGFTVGGFSTNATTVNSYPTGSVNVPSGGSTVSTVYIASGIALENDGAAATLAGGILSPGTGFSVDIGVYAGYFDSSTSTASLKTAMADFALTLEF